MLRLITLRSNDQFNTTIYGYDDRFRGIHGTRMVVFMNRDDIDRLGLREGDESSTLATAVDDGVDRAARRAARSSPTTSPRAAAAATTRNATRWSRSGTTPKRSKVPAAKSVPVRVVRDATAQAEPPAPSDMVSGHPLSDAGRDVAKLGGRC